MAEHWATENALIATGGDWKETAQLLKMHVDSIHRHIQKMHLSHLLTPSAG